MSTGTRRRLAMQGLQQCVLVDTGKGICRNCDTNGLFLRDSLAKRKVIARGTGHDDLEIQAIEIGGYLELFLLRGEASG